MNKEQYITDGWVTPQHLADLLSSIDVGERALRGATIDIFAIAADPPEFDEHPTVLPPADDGEQSRCPRIVEAESPARPTTLSDAERAELLALRRENDALRRANRKLTVASRYFAARSQPQVIE